jgi:AraC-like DNA-binding protein
MDILKSLDPSGLLLAPLLDRKAGKQNLYKPYRFRGGSCEHYFHTMMSANPDPRVSIFAGLIPLLHELCGIQTQLKEEPDTEPDSVEYQILRYLNKNIDKQISLNDICQTYYISKSQLCRIFRNCTGVTVKQYLTVKRLVKAKQLIDTGEQPTHIYNQCGFSDYSSFYRAYSKYYGHSPGQK